MTLLQIYQSAVRDRHREGSFSFMTDVYEFSENLIYDLSVKAQYEQGDISFEEALQRLSIDYDSEAVHPDDVASFN